MILTLENFRCYKGIHKWNFDSDGITLISGSSGAGKSTILMAIFFVITGSSPSKTITDGCDSCAVSLELLHYTIKRTKRPNRLVVSQNDSIIEDEVAQELVYRIFGKYYEFTSYIQQQYQKTFLYLSPSEKLEILEKLCFTETDQPPETLKKECGIQLKLKQEESISLKGKIQVLEHWIKNPIELPQQPNVSLTRSSILKRLQELDLEQKQFEQFQNLQNMYTQKQLELTQIELEQNEKHKYNEHFLNQQLSLYNEYKNIKEKNYPKPWEKYSKNETQELQTDYLKDIKLLREYKQLENKIQNLLSYEESLKQLKKQHQEMYTSIEGIYQCPSCKQKVCLLNNNLCEYSEQHKKVVEHDKKKELLKRIEEKINSLQPQIIELERHKQTILEIQEQVNTEEDVGQLENDLKWIQEYSQQQTDLERKYEMWMMRIRDIESKMDFKMDFQNLPFLLEQVKRRQHVQSILNMIEKDLEKFSTLHTNEVEIKEEKEFLLSELEKQNELEIYQIKKEKYDQYIQYLDQYTQLNQDLKKVESQLDALVEFKNIIAKTESDIIEQEITRVCELVNQIISEIFTEPIVVELKTTKKTSTQNEKLQIQLQVYYKNMCTDISILSGGELARLNLAFTLAFASITESRLVLLDECTANLDTDLTEIVIEQIKKLNIPKVILIAHQVVEGTFQQIIRI